LASDVQSYSGTPPISSCNLHRHRIFPSPCCRSGTATLPAAQAAAALRGTCHKLLQLWRGSPSKWCNHFQVRGCHAIAVLLLPSTPCICATEAVGHKYDEVQQQQQQPPVVSSSLVVNVLASCLNYHQKCHNDFWQGSQQSLDVLYPPHTLCLLGCVALQVSLNTCARVLFSCNSQCILGFCCRYHTICSRLWHPQVVAPLSRGLPRRGKAGLGHATAAYTAAIDARARRAPAADEGRPRGTGTTPAAALRVCGISGLLHALGQCQCETIASKQRWGTQLHSLL